MKNKEYIKYILSNLLFGANGLVASYILLSSTQIVFLRTLVGGASLLLLFLLGGGRFTFMKKRRQFAFLILSGIAMGTSWMFLYEAYDRIGVSLGTLLYYCGPVLVMMTAPLIFRERLRAGTLLGFAMVLVGVFLINGGAAVGAPELVGIVCGLLSAVTYAAMVICNKKAKDISGLENPTLQLVISFLTVTVFVAARGELVMQITAASLLPIAILGVFGTGIGCWLYFSSIGKLPVRTVAVFGYLELVSAVFFAAIFLQETLTPGQWLGGAMILGGAVLGEMKGEK